MKLLRNIGVSALVLAASIGTSIAAPIEHVELWERETGDYTAYRIPAIIKSTSGTLLAFCEGRKDSASDHGRIDLLLRRSNDDGRTWQPTQTVWSDGTNTCGNPAPVVDRTTGRIWLLMTWNRDDDPESRILDGTSTDTRRVFVTYSDNDGADWDEPTEITEQVKRSEWRWYATGPCHAIQLKNGRLVIPANHSGWRDGKAYTSSHAIISDDHGKTWRHSEPVGGHTNESTVAELDDGQLYLNMRSYRGIKQRAAAWSSDQGESWSEPINEPVLIEPVCQGSVLRHEKEDAPSLFFFSNPAATNRTRLTVRTSQDGCRTWNAGRLVHAGPSAYSDLVSLDEKTVGLLYERAVDAKLYQRISFARLPVEWLLADPDPEEAPLEETPAP